MKCSCTWYRSSIAVMAVAIAAASATPSFGQAFSAGRDDGSGGVDLSSGDSDGGSSSSVAPPAPVQPPPSVAPVRPNYPGPLLKGPPNNFSPPQRSTWSTTPTPDPFNAQRAVNRIDAEIANALQRRELARQRFEYGGGYARDRNAFNREQARIQALQQARMGVVQRYSNNPQALRRAQANARATYGLNAPRYRGALDTRRPIGERATSRWLNNPNYRQ